MRLGPSERGRGRFSDVPITTAGRTALVLVDVIPPPSLRIFSASLFGLLLHVRCSIQVPATTAARPVANPTHGTATIPLNPGTGAAPTGVAFDAAHVAAVLGPAVAEIIVNTGGSGVAEGSGFVVATGGRVSYIVTNNHVVEGARRVQVSMPDGRHYVAQVQGTDPQEDIAVVRVDDSLPVAQFADSTRVRVGQPVVAIGSPLGNQGSVTVGVISALHRTLTNVGGGSGRTPGENLPDVMQTDAAINPGNSGGPLADGDGHVIGVNTAGSSNAQGIGFAIPSLIAKRIADNLIAGKTPGHPYLGVCYQPVEQALATQTVNGYGIVVSKALPGTPADQGGIRSGDVIEKVDGRELNNGQTLGGVLQLHNPGDRVSMTALRNGSDVSLTVTLGERPTQNTSSNGC